MVTIKNNTKLKLLYQYSIKLINNVNYIVLMKDSSCLFRVALKFLINNAPENFLFMVFLRGLVPIIL